MLQAKLVVVGGEVQSQEVKLKLPAVIGRGKDATLKVPLALISRRHCEIREREGRLYIRDLGSLNGTYVNNYKITAEQPLLPGELVTIGTITFRAEYQLQPRPPAIPSGEQEAVVFKPQSSPGAKFTTQATPAFDSTVAGTMSVSVSPGQPVRIRESASPLPAKGPADGQEHARTAANPATPSPAVETARPQRPVAASRTPANSASEAARPTRSPRPTQARQPGQQNGSADAGLVLDDFPLDVAPQKSISLSALDELAISGPRQVSFIGDLNFGDQPRPVVDEGISIEVGSGVGPNDQPVEGRDSRLDSFLRGIEQPAD